MNTEYRIDIDVELTKIAGTRDFVEEVDDFVYGGYVHYIRRDATGCYVMMNDAWIPVVDWFDAHKFPGARDLTHLARYFYNLGKREATTPETCLKGIFDFDDISQLELAADCYKEKKGCAYPVTVKHQHEVLMKLYDLIGVDREALDQDKEVE